MHDRSPKALFFILILLALILPVVFFPGTSDNFLIKKSLFQLSSVLMTVILCRSGASLLPRDPLGRSLLIFWGVMALSLIKSSVLFVGLWELFDLSMFILFFLAVRAMRLPLRQKSLFLNACIIAGGFAQFAAPNRTRIIRKEGDKQVVRKINLNDVKKGKIADIELKPGDLIHVPETWL